MSQVIVLAKNAFKSPTRHIVKLRTRGPMKWSTLTDLERVFTFAKSAINLPQKLGYLLNKGCGHKNGKNDGVMKFLFEM